MRGHRRTYIGALPGRIVAGLKKAGSMNPVFVLDEIDKMSSDMRGDPSSAMLEVLDPEQNGEFVDHYVEVPVDLSRVMFLATANNLESIPGPLFDRMELVELPGYTSLEKLADREQSPGRRSRWPSTAWTTAASRSPTRRCSKVIHGYTREAGVRNLERELAALCRAAAVKIANGDTEHVHIGTPERIERAARARQVHHRGRQHLLPPGRRPRHGPGVDPGWRRNAAHRGPHLQGQGRDPPDRPDGRCHARERPGRGVVDAHQRHPARHRPRADHGVGPAHPPAAGRDQEGRPVRGRRAHLRGGLGAHQAPQSATTSR